MIENHKTVFSNQVKKVLVLLPVQGNMLQARYHGPYKVLKRVSDLDYVIETLDRRKLIQLCQEPETGGDIPLGANTRKDVRWD